MDIGTVLHRETAHAANNSRKPPATAWESLFPLLDGKLFSTY